MATITLTDATFEQTIADSDIVVVDFWGPGCHPCTLFAPVFEKSSDAHADVVYAKVDTEAEQELAVKMRITSIPTLVAFREGVLVFRQVGALPAAALDEVVTQVKNLDMDEVRKKLAARG